MWWTALKTPINAPRLAGLALEVINAIAGTKRPETKTMKSVVTASIATRGTGGRFVRSKIGTREARATVKYTGYLP